LEPPGGLTQRGGSNPEPGPECTSRFWDYLVDDSGSPSRDPTGTHPRVRKRRRRSGTSWGVGDPPVRNHLPLRDRLFAARRPSGGTGVHDYVGLPTGLVRLRALCRRRYCRHVRSVGSARPFPKLGCG